MGLLFQPGKIFAAAPSLGDPPAYLLCGGGVTWNLDVVGDKIWGGAHYGGPWYWDIKEHKDVVYNPPWTKELLNTPGFWGGWAGTEFDGKIWAGTFWGLARFDPSKQEARFLHKEDGLPSNQVTRLLAGPQSLYIGCENGLSIYDPQTRKFTNYSIKQGLPGGTIASMMFRENLLWLATSGGVCSFDTQKKVFTPYTTSNGLPTRLATCVSVDSKGIWVGTPKGVCRLNSKDGKVDLTIDGKDGLATEWITALGATGSCLWIGTEKGLYRYDYPTKKIERHDDPADMASNPVTDIAVTPEAVWIAISLMEGGKGKSGTRVLTGVAPEVQTRMEKLEAAAPHVPDDASCVVELGQMGPDAIAATPSLMACLGEPLLERRVWIHHALARIGYETEKNIRAIAIVLNDPKPLARVHAAGALEMMAPMSKAALDDLIAAAGDPDAQARDFILSALGQIGDPKVVLPLEKAIERSPIAALEALGRIGPASAPAAPLMKKYLASDKEQVRFAAAFALGRVGAAAETALSELAGALGDKDARVRRESLRALAALGPKIGPVVSQIEHAAQTLPAAEAVWARLCLLRAGRAPIVQLYHLHAARDQTDSPAMSASAGLALLAAGKDASAIYPDILAGASNLADPNLRDMMRLLLSELSPTSHTAAPSPSEASAEVKGFIEQISHSGAPRPMAAPTTVPQLMVQLEDKQGSVRHEAMLALASLGPRALPATEQLDQAAHHLPPAEAAWARLALLKAGHQPGIQRFLLKATCDDTKDPAASLAASLALFSAGEDARPILADIKASVLENKNPAVREVMQLLIERLL